jgi:hypothetical protein
MPNLPSDDLPPNLTAVSDRQLQRWLEAATGVHFYQACDGVTQGLLLCCEWSITTAAGLTLVINCPDQTTNWRVLNNVVALGNRLIRFSTQAKIRICPPEGEGGPVEIRVDEIAICWDSL